MSPAEIFDQHEHPAGAPLVDSVAAEWERTYAMWTHLAGLIGGIAASLSAGISIVIALLVVLILWLNKREQSPFIDDHGREAVNFQISLLIYILVLLPLIVFLTCGIGFIAAIPLALAIIVLAIVGTIMAASSASKGQYYRYPATIRLLK
jgi:uncharacterized protein